MTVYKCIGDDENPLSAIAVQLDHIARQVTERAEAEGLWRLEREELQQIARVTAWQAMQRAARRGIPAAERRRYVLGAARSECEQTRAALKRSSLAFAKHLAE